MSLHADSFDCSPSTCGSESWLILSDEYKSFVSIATEPTCGDTAKTPFLTLDPLVCKCPFEDVYPCTCSGTEGEVASPKVTVSINCTGAMLGDKGMEIVLNKVPVTTALAALVLTSNDLTYVPSKLSQFQNVVIVVLSNNNITSVKKGDLALASPKANTILLNDNFITSIEEGSFPSELQSSN